MVVKAGSRLEPKISPPPLMTPALGYGPLALTRMRNNSDSVKSKSNRGKSLEQSLAQKINVP